MPGGGAVQYRYLKVNYSHDGRVVTVMLNRPEKRNAINRDMARELRQVVEAIREDPDLAVVIIRGAGEHYCAGDDISEFPRFSDDQSAVGAANFVMREVTLYQDTANAIEELEKVVISVVDGNCIGGGLELTMVSDLVISTDRANFGIPEIDIDITPGWGGTSRLSRFVGRHKVKEMVLLGTLLNAEEARECGLVNWVVPPDRLDEATERVVGILLSKRSIVLKLMKFITTKGLETTTQGALAFEALSAMLSWTTGDGEPPAPPATRDFIVKGGDWQRRRQMVKELMKGGTP